MRLALLATPLSFPEGAMRHDDDTANRLRDEFGTHMTVRTVGVERTIIVDGRTWKVQQVLHPITLAPTLVFMNDTVARRADEYPLTWRGLTDEALYALSCSK